MSSPLDGIRIVTVEHAVAAPFATRQLADLGAQVIKVENPDGGDFARRYDETVFGDSSYFVWLNRGKESIAVDLKSTEGARVLLDLVADADVFVHNLGPGAAERLRLDAATLRGAVPGLVHCAVTGYGSDGPWSHRKAYDLLIQAETGLLSITGSPSDSARVGVSIADIAAGMHAFAGILTALVRRTATGDGATVEVSLFDSLAEWMGAPLYYTMYGGREPKRAGPHHATIAPYGRFNTATTPVVLAVQNDREWASLCTNVLGRPELEHDPRFVSNSARVAHRADLHAALEPLLARLPAEEIEGSLDEAHIAHSRSNGVTGLADHPLLKARHRWHPIATPHGEVQALLPPVSMDGVTPVMGDVPALGEHTDAVLSRLGRTPDEIDALRAAGTIRTDRKASA